METKTNLTVLDLSRAKKASATAFTGRPEGKQVREMFNLDSLDKKKNIVVEFILPENTTSFNPSFYLGLLYSSFKKLGENTFKQKYRFNLDNIDESRKKNILTDLNDGLEECKRTVHSSNSLRALKFLNV